MKTVSIMLWLALGQKVDDGGTDAGTKTRDAGIKTSPDGGAIKLDDGGTVKTLEQARDAGQLKDFVFYKKVLKDGTVVYESDDFMKPDAGHTTVDTSPCRKRPTVFPPPLCFGLYPDGGAYEQGDENVMQNGRWVDVTGDACVEVPCVVFFGEPAP